MGAAFLSLFTVCVCSEKVCHIPGGIAGCRVCPELCERAAKPERRREVACWTLAKEATLQQLRRTDILLHQLHTVRFESIPIQVEAGAFVSLAKQKQKLVNLWILEMESHRPSYKSIYSFFRYTDCPIDTFGRHGKQRYHSLGVVFEFTWWVQ